MPVTERVNEDFLVNSDPSANPFGNPTSILKLASGAFLVLWSEQFPYDGSAGCILGRLYDADGMPTSAQFVVNTSTTGVQAIPDAVELPNGNIMVTWGDASLQGGDNSSNSIKGQILTPAGAKVGGEFLVNTVTTGNQGFATTTLLNTGNVMVIWQDAGGSDGNLSGIKGQILDATGAKVGAEFLVNTETTGNQNFANVTKLANGNVVVTWSDASALGADTSGTGIKAQILDATGAKVGTEFLVNTQTANGQGLAQVAALANGNFVVTWQDSSLLGGDADSSGIKAQLFDASGTKIGGEILVNTLTLGSQTNPAITVMANGSFVIAWRNAVLVDTVSYQTIMAQAFAADGSRLGDQFLASSGDGYNQIVGSPMITDIGENRFMVTNSLALPGTPFVTQGLRGNIHVLLNQVTGATSGDDTINGSAQSDSIDGLVGNDTIYGLGGVDVINGGEGNDTLYGDDGNDKLFGDAGTDTIYGGNGDDTMDGGDGNDTINAEVGDTSVAGGTGTDTITFAASGTLTAAVSGFEVLNLSGGAIVTMTQTQLAAGFSPTSTLSGSGTLTVTMGAGDSELYLNTLTGTSTVSVVANAGANDVVIKGVQLSSNTLNGSDGFDLIRGGRLSDILNGGNGDDKVEGGQGADVLTGGAGADVFRYQSSLASGLGAAADRITDFTIGSDRLGFALIDADAVTPGDQAFSFLGTGSFGITGVGQIRYQTSGGDLLVQVDSDGNGSADMEVILQGLAGQTLTPGDFNL